MTNLNLSGGFASGMATKGTKISILAFEVANTIVKAANLMHFLSDENIRQLKKVVLPSEGLQRLISTDMDELLRIAACDKRDALKVFSGEVIRFGNRCKDPQWHNLDSYFEKLQELYHEMHAFDRFEQDCRRKAQEGDNSSAQHRGESLAVLRAELKIQSKHVKGLPPNIKSALRTRLQCFPLKEELTVVQIKGEMEKTMQWLVPMAINTTKAHHCFGWVGEWANTGSEMNRKLAGQTENRNN